MKTIFNTLVCALALSSTMSFASVGGETTTTAPKKFEVGAYIAKDNSIRVAVKKNAPEIVRLTLKNNTGDELYFQNIAKKDMEYATKLNVSDLPAGSYKLVISAGKETLVKNFEIRNETIAVQKQIAMK